MTRGQKISRTDLIRESRETLQRAGVGNHSRAAFIREITSEVVPSDQPIFVQLQPKLLPHDTEAWANAFSVACQFLTVHKLALTLETCQVEAPDVVRDQGTFFAFHRLLTKRPPKLSFPDRVSQSQFAGTEPGSPASQGSPSPRQSPSFRKGSKPGFGTPVDDGEFSASEDDFSSDFHIDDILPPRK
jgi:hypothetical protein